MLGGLQMSTTTADESKVTAVNKGGERRGAMPPSACGKVLLKFGSRVREVKAVAT